MANTKIPKPTGWASLRENAASVIVPTLAFVALYCFVHRDWSDYIALAINAVTAIALAMAYDDWEFKRVNAPELLNWQEYIGLAFTIAAICGHYFFAFDGGIRGRIGSIVMAICIPLAFWWWFGPYESAVMHRHPEAYDAYCRKKYARTIRRGNEKALRRYLERFLVYFQLDGCYSKGSVFGSPIDIQLRTCDELEGSVFWLKVKKTFTFNAEKKSQIKAEIASLGVKIREYKEYIKTLIANELEFRREVK